MNVKLIEAKKECYLEIEECSVFKDEKFEIKFVLSGVLGVFQSGIEIGFVKLPPQTARNIIQGKSIFIVTGDVNPNLVRINKHSLAS